MFCINREAELTKELLEKMLNKFRTEVQPKLIKYKDYYDGKQAILNKSYNDTSKPCNKTVINYCMNIANSYAGYMATPSFISYKSEQNIDEIMNTLKYNDYQAEDAAFLLDALIYGVACELVYTDTDSKVRFKLINPTTCFGVYDDSLTNDLLYFVRWYEEDAWADSLTYLVDIYTDNSIRHYKMEGESGAVQFINEEPHYFSQCPANIFYMPNEESIFACIMNEQDSINELISAEIDDYSAFCDAYLTITGGELQPETVKSMKENRVILLPDGASAQWLTKSANDTQVENIRKALHESIYRTAQCPDFSSESFVGGVSSGIAIQYRLTGMETRAGNIQGEMTKALQRRVEIISGIASLKLGEEIYRDITITFKRNIPEDINTTIAMVNGFKGTVSDSTLLAQVPFVADVNKELEAVEKQKAANMSLYSFGSVEE